MTMWLDEADSEFAEFDDSDELEGLSLYDVDGDAESFDAESRSAAARRNRARRRRVALAQRRRAQSGMRSRPVAAGARTPSPRQTATAIQNLDLTTKVQEDTFRSAMSAQGKRMSRSEYAAVAGAAVSQFIESFDEPSNAYFRAALRFSPLLLLSPQRRGSGFEAFIKDPRVIGAAAVAGITVVGENRSRFTAASDIRVTSVSELTQGSDLVFFADVVDVRGSVIAGKKVAWASTDPTRATVDPITGQVTAVAKGPLFITAEVDGVPIKRVPLVVK